MRKTLNCAVLALALPLLLVSCAAAPSVCPSPPLPPAPVPLGPSFQDRMQLFLSGKLPAQTNSGPTLPPAKSASAPG